MASTPLDSDPDAAAQPGVPPDPRDRGRRLARRRGAPLVVAAAVAAGWAALVSYAAVLALTALASAGSSAGFGAVARLAAGAWLLGHGIPLRVGGEHITLVPLAIGILAAWRLLRAGVHTSRAIGGHRSRTVRPAIVAGIATGFGYGCAGAVAALTTATVSEAWRALLTLGGFGALFATLGAIRSAAAGRALGDRIPLVVRDAVRSGVTAVSLIVAAGAGIAGVSLAVHGGTAADLLGSYQAGFLGQAGITLLCLAYLPNLAVWGAAYLLGPGFAVGADTLISPGEVLVGPVPSIPVLAALPSGPLSGVGPALLGIPLAAGICAGLLLTRRRRTERRNLVAAGVLAGPVAGILLQVAGFAAAGALGSERLLGVGRVTWWVGLLGALVVSVGGVVAAIGIRAVSGPRAADV